MLTRRTCWVGSEGDREGVGKDRRHEQGVDCEGRHRQQHIQQRSDGDLQAERAAWWRSAAARQLATMPDNEAVCAPDSSAPDRRPTQYCSSVAGTWATGSPDGSRL